MSADLLPPSFGDGWMSANARDLARIVIWAGWPRAELLQALARAGTPGRVMNVATVERVLQAQYDAAK